MVRLKTSGKRSLLGSLGWSPVVKMFDDLLAVAAIALALCVTSLILTPRCWADHAGTNNGPTGKPAATAPDRDHLSASRTAVQRGYRLLTEKAYLPADFDQHVFDQLWQTWPEPLRSKAAKADIAQRRQMAFTRYGLTPRPDDPRRPLQYVVSQDGSWSMNCFACHGGAVNGRVIPGLPNSHYALEMLTNDVLQTKLRLHRPLTHMDVGSLFMPLGGTRGTTNAVMFGVALLSYRDHQLNRLGNRLPPAMVHHDMDAPPWWHFSKKQQLYIDGFAPKGHRALMQFMLVEQNGPEDFRRWEDDFRDVMAYITSLKPPAYNGPIDQRLAARGRDLFRSHCADCHGGAGRRYPERRIAWKTIETDRVRLDALTAEHRKRYAESWFHALSDRDVVLDPKGYVAPPLDGVWASAPYLHNGSVPTLWHLLHPDQRPEVWRRNSTGYDHQQMGLDIVSRDLNERKQPTNRANTKEWFDTRRFGKSASGHRFPDVLSEQQKKAVLEFLKTL